MKDFRELMEIRDEMIFMSLHSRIFKPIHIGNLQISIQASQNHYCSPRETIELKDYDCMEIAIFENDEWISPFTDERFKEFNRIGELLERYEDCSCPVGGFIDIDLIQDLCNYLEKL